MDVSVWFDDDSDDMSLHGAIVNAIVMSRIHTESVKNDHAANPNRDSTA